MTEARSAPANLDSLSRRIANVADGRGRVRRHVQRAVANTIVGQMLPPGAVMGGTALTLRLGESATRFSPVVDLMHPPAITAGAYVAELRSRLDEGFGAFNGTLEEFAPTQLAAQPGAYALQALRVRLAYRGRHWLTLQLRLGHDDVDGSAHPQPRLAKELSSLFVRLGLAAPAPVPLLAIAPQVVQKLHACTTVNARSRAQDLVDLQLLDRSQPIDMADVGAIGERLFARRGVQGWPPTVVAHDGWEAAYSEAAEGLELLADVEQAVVWTNALIARELLS